MGRFELVVEDFEWSATNPFGSGSRSNRLTSENLDRDRALNQAMDRYALAAGGQLSKSDSRKGETQITRPGGPAYWPQDYTELITVVTYAFASAAAFAVFVRNVVGTLKDWRDLRAGRQVKIVIAGQMHEVKDGQDVTELLQAVVKPAGENK
ncbi:hypothetical protein J2W42_002183 [Rhizobium tibeticum]|uniref:hypothetical protein n=1 Tax=Rhizobium tibeticum TaxID=501024 RepID=UPI00278454C3|nr:hypothetical protein [Rhizobium tibeticum]MDP9809335.1 hypothetical protein [Rhizobium tibeticum]